MPPSFVLAGAPRRRRCPRESSGPASRPRLGRFSGRWRGLLLWALLGASSLVVAPPASAQTAPEAPAPAVSPLADSLHGMARADYAAARILYEDGDYAGAFTKLEGAYRASKDARLLWNMAACEKELRHYANVISLLERYLDEGKNLISSDEREATRELLLTVQAFVNELDLVVQPEGAAVYLDGVEVARSPLERPLRVDMGKRKLLVQKAGFVSQQADIDLGGGKRMSLSITLKPELHEGTLRVVSEPSAVISVDGHVVATATWAGQLPSGAHSVHVSAPGKRAHETEVVIKEDATSSLHVNLQDEAPLLARPEEGGAKAWWWVVGGAVVAGAGVGAYLLLRPQEEPRQPELGTWGGFEL